MPKSYDWKPIRAFYERLPSNTTAKEAIALTAAQFGVHPRSVQNHSQQWRWVAGRANIDNIVAFERPESIDKKLLDTQADHLGLLNAAITGISQALSAVLTPDGCTDLREAAAGAGALVKLIELHRKISPPSATDLADVAIAAGISPQEFIGALQKQWRERG